MKYARHHHLALAVGGRHQALAAPKLDLSRDSHFERKAGVVLDLYHRTFAGKALRPNEYVLSADEKPSIQARCRCHPTLPPSAVKTAIYARYSSGLQKATSIEDQVGLCREAAPRFYSLVLEDQIYADREISGTVEQRPGYVRLMKAAKAGEFEAILIEAQDRLWRDQGEMHSALKRLRFWGIKVFSVSTGTDLTDKTGKLMASVVGWKDEIFAEDLRDKTRRGMMAQIKRGFSAGGRAYGYRSEPIYDPSKKDAYGNPLMVGSRRAINVEEADVVVRVFQLYAAGLSAKTIPRRLNEERVPPPTGEAERARTARVDMDHDRWIPQGSFGILNNPIYIGQMVWNRCQKIRDGHRQASHAAPKQRRLGTCP